MISKVKVHLNIVWYFFAIFILLLTNKTPIFWTERKFFFTPIHIISILYPACYPIYNVEKVNTSKPLNSMESEKRRNCRFHFSCSFISKIDDFEVQIMNKRVENENGSSPRFFAFHTFQRVTNNVNVS